MLSQYLDVIMRNQGISNDADLARRTGVNQTQIGNWRKGSSRPSMALLDRMAYALDVPPVNLHIQAGWVKPTGKPAPDLAILPREFGELIDLYTAPERTDDELDTIRTSLRLALAGLRSLLSEVTPAKKPGRRRIS